MFLWRQPLLLGSEGGISVLPINHFFVLWAKSILTSPHKYTAWTKKQSIHYKFNNNHNKDAYVCVLVSTYPPLWCWSTRAPMCDLVSSPTLALLQRCSSVLWEQREKQMISAYNPSLCTAASSLPCNGHLLCSSPQKVLYSHKHIEHMNHPDFNRPVGLTHAFCTPIKSNWKEKDRRDECQWFSSLQQ